MTKEQFDAMFTRFNGALEALERLGPGMSKEEMDAILKEYDLSFADIINWIKETRHEHKEDKGMQDGSTEVV